MPADLTREEIECAVHHVALFGHANAPSPVRGLTVGGLLGVLRAAAAHLDEPARLAAARAEGYREGVEAAAKLVDQHYPLTNRGAGGVGGHDSISAAIRALTPPPAEPADWTVSDTELARDILSYLGIGSDASLEPGDRRRDHIAAMICADRERRIVKPAEPSAPVAEPITPEEVMQVARCVKREAEGAAAARITALEAENAALKADNARLREWSATLRAAIGSMVEDIGYGGSDAG